MVCVLLLFLLKFSKKIGTVSASESKLFCPIVHYCYVQLSFPFLFGYTKTEREGRKYRDVIAVVLVQQLKVLLYNF